MDALLLVDIQNDFLPGGNLAVADADRILPIVNSLIQQFPLVIATQDWHPANHKSFAASHPNRSIGELIQLRGQDQILWPVHCVQGSSGARLAAELNQSAISRIVYKGTNPEIDSYSAFFDNGRLQATELHEYLREIGVQRLFVAGLATDFCIKFTVKDACSLGYETWLIPDACRAVNLAQGDEERAIQSMVQAGAKIVSSFQLLKTREVHAVA